MGDHDEQEQLRSALLSLTILGDDMFMRMQAFNLSIVDSFLMQLEADVLRKLIEEERTPPEAWFLSAQSQMWMFAAYELIRTWRQRVSDIRKWSETGGLEQKLKSLETDVGYRHFGRQMRANQLKSVIADPSLVGRIKDDLRATHMLFVRMEVVRISVAKHEVAGRKNAVAFNPGYGRINRSTGSLDYELENGRYIIGYVSRRDLADEIRALANRGPPPDEQTLAEFDAFMDGSAADVPDF